MQEYPVYLQLNLIIELLYRTCDIRTRKKYLRKVKVPHMRRFTSTLQAWHKIVLFSAHVQINLEKLITSS